MATNSFVLESSQGPNLNNGENSDGDGLQSLNRPDDPSFEIEDSVRCTRCTSTQSLSSLFPVNIFFLNLIGSTNSDCLTAS